MSDVDEVVKEAAIKRLKANRFVDENGAAQLFPILGELILHYTNGPCALSKKQAKKKILDFLQTDPRFVFPTKTTIMLKVR